MATDPPLLRADLFEGVIAYGAEVHHDLVNDGENPIGRVAPRDAEAGTRH